MSAKFARLISIVLIATYDCFGLFGCATPAATPAPAAKPAATTAPAQPAAVAKSRSACPSRTLRPSAGRANKC